MVTRTNLDYAFSVLSRKLVHRVSAPGVGSGVQPRSGIAQGQLKPA